MTSTIAIAFHISSPPTYSTILPHKPATADDVEMQVLDLPPSEVTSNVRHGSPSPDSPSRNEQPIPSHSHIRAALPDDPVFGLPPPDLAPRFVFKPYPSSVDETTLVSTSNGILDAIDHIQTLPYAPSPPAPRIYFADSALAYIPPLSYDYLPRDPIAKGAPRNYRSWARTGRPKLDVEGVERAEAKSDFLAMGLSWQQDSESEDGGKEGEEKKRRRRKKKMDKAQMVPIERPRRNARKIVEAEPAMSMHLPKKRATEKTSKQSTPRPTTRPTPKLTPIPTQIPAPTPKPTSIPTPKPPSPVEKSNVVLEKEAASEQGTASKSLVTSDSSGRRSSSTLLDTDVTETSKKKRGHSDNERHDVPPVKKQRISTRLFAKKHGTPERSVSPRPVPKEEQLERIQSPLSDLTPSPEPSNSVEHKREKSQSTRRRTSSPGPSRSRPQRAARGVSHSAPAGSSRPTPIPASRPGHRINRDVSSAHPHSTAIRTFPTSLPIIPGYSGFYRRYPLVTQFEKDDPVGKHINRDDSELKRTLGNWNAPREHRDLYTPRYTKGSGSKKIALCPLCYEDTERGGEGRQEWNHTKTSQHNYHMQYYHGISPTRCAPFSPPIAQRTVPVPRPQTNEKSEILQGKCHCCKQWIALEGCKIGELKVKELFWWKHAAGCHKDSKLNGEADIFMEDDAFRRLKEYEAANSTQG